MGNFYWLPLLKKLPVSMVEGFQEVKEILAEKGLTCCPPIAHSDLEDGTSASSRSSSNSTHTSASISSGNGGEVVVLPPESKIRMGSSGDRPRPERFANPSDGGANSVSTIFEYYKLGLLMGVPHNVLTRNPTKDDRMEMLVIAQQMNSQLDVPHFFCKYLNWRMSMDV